MAHSLINWVAVGIGVLAGFEFGLATEWFLGSGYRNYKAICIHINRNHTTEERELAVTQDPLAWPVGREWAHLDGAGCRYIVSRLEDLGSISVIGVGQVQQWRVYGRPA
jgi:hypothetical protein